MKAPVVVFVMGSHISITVTVMLVTLVEFKVLFMKDAVSNSAVQSALRFHTRRWERFGLNSSTGIRTATHRLHDGQAGL